IDGVKVHVAEGRSFLERTEEKYDLIQLSGVDTQSSSQAGAFALSENYLYTKEAFVSYLQHLKPGGMLTLSRWHLPDRAGRKTYSLRMVNIVREALEELGIEPEGRVWNLRDRSMITLVAVQLDPFTPEQIEKGVAFTERNEFIPMLVPGRRLGNVFEEFLYAPREEYEAQLASYPYLVAPPTDDRPFIFELQRIGSAFVNDDWPHKSATITGQEILLVVLAELSVLGLLFLVVPTVWLQRRRNLATPWTARLYFCLIGYAYISVEIALAQKFVLYLGHPTYSLSVVICGMLVFSGLASMVSGRLGDRARLMVLLLPPVLAVAGLLLSPVLDATLATSFGLRLALTMAFMAPVAFLMGFPFPFGIGKTSEESVPLLWAANGFFSVVGSVLAVITSINWGFGAVLLVSTLAYVGAAYLGARTSFRTEAV
ncbi:MAG: hypothetical protein MJE66_13025, partial [Proteobacteria bacterium]|nr:hypothetical protein [Pseudomonadota bacterium]